MKQHANVKYCHGGCCCYLFSLLPHEVSPGSVNLRAQFLLKDTEPGHIPRLTGSPVVRGILSALSPHAPSGQGAHCFGSTHPRPHLS